MPLNFKNGENLEGLGRGFKIVPLAKWQETAMYVGAAEHAQKEFLAAKGIVPRSFDSSQVLVQEYPLTGQLAFVFCMSIRGEEIFVPFMLEFTPEQIAELTVAGMWTSMVRA